MLELSELVDMCHEMERKNITEGGEVMPHYLFQNDDGDLTMLATPWHNYRDPQEKRTGVTVAKLVALQHLTTSLVFVSEAWTSQVSPEDMARYDRGEAERPEPSQDPDKREVLLVMGRDQSGAAMFTALISRVGGRRFLGPLERMGGDIVDNMSDVLPPPLIVKDLAAKPEERRKLQELMALFGAKDVDDVRPSDLGIVH